MEYFCYTIAHNFRAPLRAISGFADVLKDRLGSSDQEGEEYAKRISDAGQRMDHLVNDLLEFGKLSHAEIALEEIDVADLVQEILLELEPQRAACIATVECKKPFETVWSDRKLLRVAIRELLINAFRFIAPDRVPNIEVRCRKHQHAIQLEVSDNGLGIEARFHDQIFEIFSKLDAESPGTGVGLALVRNAVERLGGSIKVQSTPHQGSCFSIVLPRA